VFAPAGSRAPALTSAWSRGARARRPPMPARHCACAARAGSAAGGAWWRHAAPRRAGRTARARRWHARRVRACARRALTGRPRARAQAGAGARVELACLAWNRKVQHILATGRLDGGVVVYDLKKQRPIIELKDKAGCAPGRGARLRGAPPPRLPAASCALGELRGAGLSRLGPIPLPGCGMERRGLQATRRRAVAGSPPVFLCGNSVLRAHRGCHRAHQRRQGWSAGVAGRRPDSGGSRAQEDAALQLAGVEPRGGHAAAGGVRGRPVADAADVGPAQQRRAPARAQRPRQGAARRGRPRAERAGVLHRTALLSDAAVPVPPTRLAAVSVRRPPPRAALAAPRRGAARLASQAPRRPAAPRRARGAHPARAAQGVYGVAWSAADPALLLSTGKDGRTLLWDAAAADERGDPLGELRAPGGWAFDVLWAPAHPGVFALSSFGGSGQGGKARPPSWRGLHRGRGRAGWPALLPRGGRGPPGAAHAHRRAPVPGARGLAGVPRCGFSSTGAAGQRRAHFATRRSRVRGPRRCRCTAWHLSRPRAPRRHSMPTSPRAPWPQVMRAAPPPTRPALQARQRARRRQPLTAGRALVCQA
jgi:hypothetical protein